MLKIKIYSGLSVNEETIRKHLPEAIYSPPIKRDDLYKDIKEGIHVVGIIDGEFLQNLAVTPTEICDAMRCGMSVYGSSSMGAMRAAELSQFGMIGHGKIYEQIMNEAYFRDDKLGQIYYEEIDYKSTPYVDLHFVIDELMEKRLIGMADGKHLKDIYEKLHFSERTFEGLVAHSKHKVTLVKTLGIVKKNFFSQKNRDGVELIKLINSNTKKHRIRLQKFL